MLEETVTAWPAAPKDTAVEIVTLEMTVCAAVQTLVEESKVLGALTDDTQIGAEPWPWLCRIWPEVPAAPLAISVPLSVSELPATIVMPPLLLTTKLVEI